MNDHIFDGSDEAAWGRDNYISFSRDLKTVKMEFGSKWGIVRVDLNKVGGWIDAAFYATNPRARALSASEKEVVFTSWVDNNSLEWEVEPRK